MTLRDLRDLRGTTSLARYRASDTETMRALEWHGIRNVQVRERPKPQLTHAQDAILRVTTTTVCGSDLHLYHHDMAAAMKRGDVLGHEFVGILEDVGPGVKRFSPGDRVVGAFPIACGTCWFCERELYSSCETTNPNRTMTRLFGQHIAGVYGYSHLLGGYDGGQAEYVRVPFADVNLLKLHPDIRDEQAIFLSDVLCTGWHAATLGEVEPGDTVAVWGCGPVGQLAMESARVKGAERIIAIDNIPYRLDVARQRFGAETINFDEDRADVTVRELTHGKGPDVCIDAVGFRYPNAWYHRVEKAVKLETDSTEVLSECIRTVRKGGNVGVVGDYIGYGNHFPIGALMEKSITLRLGQTPVQHYWRDLQQMMVDGIIDPTFTISHRFPLEEAAEAYRIFDQKEDNALKIILEA